MKKLLMAWVLAIVICLQSGVSMAATEDMAKIDSIEVKELGLNLIKVEMPLEKGFESIYGQDYAPLTILVYNDKGKMIAIDEPFAHKLTSEKYDYVKEQMIKKLGEPDKIEKLADNTITIWYTDDKKNIDIVLNSKSITQFFRQDDADILKKYKSSMQIKDFINCIKLCSIGCRPCQSRTIKSRGKTIDIKSIFM